MQTEALKATEIETREGVPNWVSNVSVLWAHRRTLVRGALLAFVLSVAAAFIIPNQYQSTARIMPPETSGAGTALLAAIAGRTELAGLSGLAGSLLGTRTTGPLFVDLLRSATISSDLIDQFQLQHVYR